MPESALKCLRCQIIDDTAILCEPHRNRYEYEGWSDLGYSGRSFLYLSTLSRVEIDRRIDIHDEDVDHALTGLGLSSPSELPGYNVTKQTTPEELDAWWPYLKSSSDIPEIAVFLTDCMIWGVTPTDYAYWRSVSRKPMGVAVLAHSGLDIDHARDIASIYNSAAVWKAVSWRSKELLAASEKGMDVRRYAEWHDSDRLWRYHTRAKVWSDIFGWDDEKTALEWARRLNVLIDNPPRRMYRISAAKIADIAKPWIEEGYSPHDVLAAVSALDHFKLPKDHPPFHPEQMRRIAAEAHLDGITPLDLNAWVRVHERSHLHIPGDITVAGLVRTIRHCDSLGLSLTDAFLWTSITFYSDGGLDVAARCCAAGVPFDVFREWRLAAQKYNSALALAQTGMRGDGFDNLQIANWIIRMWTAGYPLELAIAEAQAAGTYCLLEDSTP